jgi:hypothetical protein
MALDEHGCTPPGTIGRSVHHGDPLTVEQIRALPDGAEVVITWDGGNGPWPYRILVDFAGERRVESVYADALLKWDDQRVPFHRVTPGWGEGDAEWDAARYISPRECEELARLRGRRTDAT